MRINRILRTLIILVILSSAIGCDQISKSIVRQRVGYNEEFHFLYNHLTLTKIENTGAFLSLGQSLPKLLKVILLILTPLIVLGIAIFYLLSNKNLSKVSVIGISFIIGGGVGNIYDRIVYGSVTDFLHIDFVLFQTGIFNLADVSVMAGVFALLLESGFGQMINKKAEA